MIVTRIGPIQPHHAAGRHRDAQALGREASSRRGPRDRESSSGAVRPREPRRAPRPRSRSRAQTTVTVRRSLSGWGSEHRSDRAGGDAARQSRRRVRRGCVEALATADVVAAEDTRRARRLAADLGVTIAGPDRLLLRRRRARAIRRSWSTARAGGPVVLVVSDAGMPTVSDPGLPAGGRGGRAPACRSPSFPGPSAVLTALAVSGLPVDRFCFEGFLPRKAGERASRHRRTGGRAAHDGVLRGAAPAGGDARRARRPAWGRTGPPRSAAS